MTEQLLKQLQANLKFIENPDNYFSMFKYTIKSCTMAEIINQLLHDSEALSDEEYRANANRISEAKTDAVKLHAEWTIKSLEESNAKHTVRSFVSTVYSDLFEIYINS